MGFFLIEIVFFYMENIFFIVEAEFLCWFLNGVVAKGAKASGMILKVSLRIFSLYYYFVLVNRR